jgi:hypothetical protein
MEAQLNYFETRWLFRAKVHHWVFEMKKKIRYILSDSNKNDYANSF